MMNAFFQQRWTRGIVIPLIICGLAANANPLGEAVRSGQVQFERTDGGLRILQGSDKAIIDWDSFSISNGEFTEFIQPSERSAALNRVHGATASQIDGALRANGNVILINPNGIVIGPSGTIDVGGFIASTLDISDAEFLAGGDLNFRGPSQKGIVNLGSISATGGDVFLIAATAENSGTISAPNGTVGLAAGNDVLLKEAGSGPERIFVRGASGGKKATGVVNKGTINANIAELKAHGGNVYALAVNNEGRVAATGVSHEGGQIFLRAGGSGARIRNSGTLKATRQNGDGGRIEIDAGPGGEVENAGTIDVSSDSGTGGEIYILGSQITLEPGSLVIADGAARGGEIFIGGGQRGQDGDLMNAENVTVSEGATISANGTGANANGGQVIVFADNRLDFSGQVSAAGGANGAGGFIELSGKNEVLIPDLSTRINLGGNGTLLFDPNDITIIHDSISLEGTTINSNIIVDADINSFLDNEGSLIIETTGTDGDITMENMSLIEWSEANSLTFNADRDFIMTGGLDAAQIQSSGAGDLTVNAGRTITLNSATVIDANSGNVSLLADQNIALFADSRITTVGGDVTLDANQGPVSAAGGFEGIFLESASILTTDGDVKVIGTGGDAGGAGRGVHLRATSSIEATGSGEISIVGQGASGSTGTREGIGLFTSTVRTNNGNLMLEGTGGGDGAGDAATGVVSFGTLISSTGSGDVSITGKGGDATNAHGFHAFSDVTATGGGNITIDAQGGTGAGSTGVVTVFSPTIGGATATGNITIRTDSISLSTGTIVQSSGDLIIAPLRSDTEINLGDGTADNGLHLDNAEIATFADGFNSIAIGSAGFTTAETFDGSTLPDSLEIGVGSATVFGGLLEIGSYATVRTVAADYFTQDFVAEIDWNAVGSGGDVILGLGTGVTPPLSGNPDARAVVGYPSAVFIVQDNGMEPFARTSGSGFVGTLRLTFNSTTQELTPEVIRPGLSNLNIGTIDLSDNGFDDTNSHIYIRSQVRANDFDNLTITQGHTGQVNIGGGVFQDNLTIQGGAINVTGLNAGNNTVNLIANAGAISDAADTAIDVTAGSVNFLAPENIGASSNAISVSSGATVAANSSGGGIFLDGGGDLDVGTVGTTVGLTTDGGAIEVATPAGRLDIQQAIQSNGGDIDLSGLGIDLSTATADVINTGAGTITLTATQNVTMPMGSIFANDNIVINANQAANAGNFNGIEVHGAIRSDIGTVTLNGTGGNAVGNSGVWVAGATGVEGSGDVKITGASQLAEESGVIIEASVLSHDAGVEIRTNAGLIEIGSTVAALNGVSLFGSATENTEFLITGGIQLEDLTVDGGAVGTYDTVDFSLFNEGPLDLQADQLTDVDVLIGTGNAGDNFFGSKSSAATYTITGLDEVSYEDSLGKLIDLQSFENLTGGDLDDRFVVQNVNSLLSGNIDGGAHTTNDTLDYTNGASPFGPVAVDFENGTGTGISGTFSNVENFIGSADSADNFTGPASGLIEITGADELETPGVFTAQGFENVSGGTGVNTFEFNPGGSIAGMLDGGGGPNNTLSFANFDSAVAINLENRTATGVGQTISGFDNFIGSPEMTDQITLFDAADQIEVDNDDSGTINGNLDFSLIESVDAGGGNDQFNFNGLFTFTNLIEGGDGVDTLNIDTEGAPAAVGTPNTAVISEGQISINPVWNFTGFEDIAIQMGAGNDSIYTQPTSFSQTLDGGGGTDSLFFPDAPFGSGSPVLGVTFNGFEQLFFAPNTDTGDVLSPVTAPDPTDPISLPEALTDIGGLFQIVLPDPSGSDNGGTPPITFTEIGSGDGFGAELLQNVLGSFSAITQQTVIVAGADGSTGIVVAPLSLDGSGVQPSNLGVQLLQQALAPDSNTELLGALGLELGIALLSQDGAFALDLSGPPLAITVQTLVSQLSPNAQADLQNALEIAVVISLTSVDGSIAIDSTDAQPAQATIFIFNDQLGEAALNELNAALGIQ